MDRDALINELKGIIEVTLKNKNVDLVDITCRRQGKDIVLQVFVDKPDGGISLGDCAYLNNEIGAILEEKEIIKESYILEVSSPGIDRPLKTKNDFSRCINRRVKFFLNEQVEGQWELEGSINKAEDSSVYIDIEGKIIEIPFSKITKAKQIV